MITDSAIDVPRFAYTVWFSDLTIDPCDQCQEWVAVFLVEAKTARMAQSWGDHLANSYSDRSGEEAVFQRSEVTTLDDPVWSRGRAPWSPPLSWNDTPVVRYGHEASDDEIGW
ncbi:MAG TPA: hypothetical protein VFQ91_00685 [Bryobacteraceae bacterium]|nr:hypothetical protein [Bryobacteraceae bacterium]